MFHADIIAAARRAPTFAGRGDVMVQTAGPDGACVASVTAGAFIMAFRGDTAADAESSLLLALVAQRFDAEVQVRPGYDDGFWAELLGPATARPSDGRPVLAWAEGPTRDAARAALATAVAGGSLCGDACVVCGGPTVTRLAKPFVVADGWPLAARRVHGLGGALCAVCGTRGVRGVPL